jgi:hypothetical protein
MDERRIARLFRLAVGGTLQPNSGRIYVYRSSNRRR